MTHLVVKSPLSIDRFAPISGEIDEGFRAVQGGSLRELEHGCRELSDLGGIRSETAVKSVAKPGRRFVGTATMLTGVDGLPTGQQSLDPDLIFVRTMPVVVRQLLDSISSQ